MYGLPQSGLLANELLEKRLNKHGYRQSKLVPGLWRQDTRPVQFTLVVDNFGVKCVGEEHANHLKPVLEEHYTLTCDWTETRYIGITLDWNYTKHQVHLSMPKYVTKALKNNSNTSPQNANMHHTRASQFSTEPKSNTQLRSQKHPYWTTRPNNSSSRFTVNSYS